jgi:hypothetical protein
MRDHDELGVVGGRGHTTVPLPLGIAVAAYARVVRGRAARGVVGTGLDVARGRRGNVRARGPMPLSARRRSSRRPRPTQRVHTLRFEPAPAPSHAELQETLAYVYARVVSWRERRGIFRDDHASNEAPPSSPREAMTLAGMQRGTLETTSRASACAATSLVPPSAPSGIAKRVRSRALACVAMASSSTPGRCSRPARRPWSLRTSCPSRLGNWARLLGGELYAPLPASALGNPLPPHLRRGREATCRAVPERGQAAAGDDRPRRRDRHGRHRPSARCAPSLARSAAAAPCPASDERAASCPTPAEPGPETPRAQADRHPFPSLPPLACPSFRQREGRAKVARGRDRRRRRW